MMAVDVMLLLVVVRNVTFLHPFASFKEFVIGPCGDDVARIGGGSRKCWRRRRRRLRTWSLLVVIGGTRINEVMMMVIGVAVVSGRLPSVRLL